MSPPLLKLSCNSKNKASAALLVLNDIAMVSNDILQRTEHPDMTPAMAYRRLNTLLWHDRLPKAVLKRVDNSVMPLCHGLTLQEEIFSRPMILLNSSTKNWTKTLVHEMLHIAEPELAHGQLFDTLVQMYWRIAKQHVKGLSTP
jgi:hypothetical protein